MTRLGVFLLIGLAAASFVTAAIIMIDLNATERATVKTERQNNAAGDGADGARDRFDDCASGMWDFGAGKCLGPAPRRRN